MIEIDFSKTRKKEYITFESSTENFDGKKLSNRYHQKAL
jgi:hypothetical protein